MRQGLAKTRGRTLVFIFFAFAGTCLSQPLPVFLERDDWGLSNFESIRLGQFSLIHKSGRPELVVQALYDSAYFARSVAAPASKDCIRVLGPHGETINCLGGSCGTFHGGGSSASLSLTLQPATSPYFSANFNKTATGYCGFWVHLFNSVSPEETRRYFDIRSFRWLTLSVRGRTGSERIILRFADKEFQEKDDSLPLGDLSLFLPSQRIDTTWQTAVVPLKNFPPRLDQRRMASLVLECVSSGTGGIDLRDVALCRDSLLSESSPPIGLAAISSTQKQALWVWNTGELIRNNGDRDAFIQLLHERPVQHVFLALPYDGSDSLSWEGVTLNASRLAPLVRSLNGLGINVHALIGDRDFILPEHRPFVRRTLENIVQYNKSVEPGQRFAGIHLDVEPYLLPGFSSPRRAWFSQNLVDVLSESAAIARESGMMIGADIPTWYDNADELTHDFLIVPHNGSGKPLSETIIELMDNVALMDYRTAAMGEGKIVASALAELEYASVAKKEIFIGLETTPLPDETLMTIRGNPGRGLPPLADPRQFICIAATATRGLVSFMTEKSGSDFQELLEREKIPEQAVLWWPVHHSAGVEGKQLSFAGEGKEKLQRVMKECEPFFLPFSSFRGFAIHDLVGLQRLLK